MSQTTSNDPEPTAPTSSPGYRFLASKVNSANSANSEYRIHVTSTNTIKFLSIFPDIFDADVLSSPDALYEKLPPLPVLASWTRATVSRRMKDKDVTNKGKTFNVAITYKVLDGVADNDIWGPERIDVLLLKVIKPISDSVQDVTYQRGEESRSAIAKIACFESDIPAIVNETRAHRLLQGKDIAPALLGHLYEYEQGKHNEHKRVMGILLEKLDGQVAGSADADACEKALKRLHDLGIALGSPTKHDFLNVAGGVKIINFHNARTDATPEELEKEVSSLKAAFQGDGQSA